MFTFHYYMTTTIFTVIKNEHPYLDEWISYHLSLGIDHIFIFQDIDSNDHSYITNKYSQVTLSNISILLNDQEKSQVKYIRQTGNSNPQFIYIRNGLLYIQSNFNYDWCFVIDVDEFLTTDKLNMDRYKDYDAVILQWKCYGANGHITKPNTSVLESYTEMKGYVPTVTLESYTKTCYNLNTYQPNFFKYTHQPSKHCNFCRTDFSKDRTKPIYDYIYIRHYITKSWQEYVTKRIVRGYLYGKTRTLDFFFDVNPDLIHMKEQLINQIYNKTLVVLAYKQAGSQGNELELCLQSWKQFCQFDYHFVVIGDFDNTLISKYDWVEFIHKDPLNPVPNQYNPHLDILSKLEYVMDKHKDIYKGFIWIADDNYAIKPFTLLDITTVHCHQSSIRGKIFPTHYWIGDKNKTIELLEQQHLPTTNYTTHYPCYFETDKLKQLIEKYNLRKESYVVEDLYFNTYDHPEPISDTNIRITIWNKDEFKQQFQQAISNPNIKFIANGTKGWSKELEETLKVHMSDFKFYAKP